MKNYIITFIFALILSIQATAADFIVIADPSNPGNKKISKIPVANNVISKTNSVTSVSVIGTETNSSTEAVVVKTGAGGQIDSTLIPSPTFPFSHQYLTDAASSWTNSYSVTSVLAEAWGAGGTGGAGGSTTSSGGGGGGGAYCRGIITVTNNQVLAIQVSGPTTIGAFSAAVGGTGGAGSAGVGGVSGLGGIGTGALENLRGSAGEHGVGTGTNPSGAGGAGAKGSGGGIGVVATANGNAGTVPGGGGAGGSGNATTGGAGGGGRVIIWY